MAWSWFEGENDVDLQLAAQQALLARIAVMLPEARLAFADRLEQALHR